MRTPASGEHVAGGQEAAIRIALIAVSVIAAISRFFALAQTPWDWDELLFIHALEHFDVSKHWPHPPGFPLYILSGTVVRNFGLDDFQALQALSFIAAVAIVPAMFFLCRELRMRYSTSLAASVLLAFFPNVWFYGGAAFSDVPSMTLSIVAMGLLVAGCRDARAYLAGATVLAIASGYRPQNLLIGIVPLLMATYFQLRRRVIPVVVAAAIVTATVVASYGAAAWLTGWSEYREALQAHREYIMQTDSFLAPGRPHLWRVFDDFFVRPYHAPIVNGVLTALALVSAVASMVGRRMHILAALAAFGPLCLITWLVLDRFSASRFSIGYAPLMAILVADGLQLIVRRPIAEWIASTAISAGMIGWTWPALAVVRHADAPPVAAVRWIRGHLPSRASMINVDTTMVPFAEWYLPDYRLSILRDVRPAATGSVRQPVFYLFEGASRAPGGENFVRPRTRLWNLVRRRYFEVAVQPVTIVTFGDGWYGEEGADRLTWRWMAGRSRVALPPIQGRARLTLSFHVPLDVLRSEPNVTVRVNGAMVDAFRATSSVVEREITVLSRGNVSEELIIETDRVATPAAQHISSDRRVLGLRLNSLGWFAVR